MHRKLLLIVTACLLSLPAWGQVENPRIDVFGGYSHVGNFDVGMSGWMATANLHLFRWVGVEGDVSGNYGSKGLGQAALILPNIPNSINSRMHSFNFGPVGTYRAPSGKYNAFGHVLLGFSHTNVNSAGIGRGDTAFSWVLGGGADYNFRPNWAVRAQLDLLRTHFFSQGQNHGRIGLGLVYRFGK